METEGKAFFEEYLYGADPEFFKLLTFEILPGAPASVLERPYTVAIAEDVALRYFGTTDAVGKVLDFTGFIPFGRYTVDAVFRTFPTNSSYQFNIILRFTDIVKLVQPTDLENWGNNNYHYWVKTSAGTDPHQVEDQVHAFYANKYKDASDDREGQSTFPLEPLREIYVRAKSDVNFSSAPSNDINRLYMLATTAVLVLLIAGINYVNLTTARAVSRAREVGVRKVSGANHLNLIAQFMTDTMMVTLISAAVAVAATWSLMPWFRAFLGKDIPFDLFRDPSSVLLFTTITLVIGLLAGLYPAVVLSSFLPARVLKGTFARSSEGATLRSGLTVFQFTISGALIMGVLIIGQQLRFIERHNPGYDREQIITVSLLDEGVRNKRDVLIEELKKHPGVINVTFASYLPNAVNTQQSRIWKSAEGSFEVSFYTTHVDHNYLDVFGITLVEGRNFQPDLPGDRNAFIINETAAKAYGWEHPVGMQFTGERTGQPGDTVTIIGVMKDFHFVNYRLPIKPLRFGLNRNWSSQLAVKVHPDRIPEVLSHLEANYRKLATTRMPYAYNFFDEQFGNAYKSDRQLGVLTSVFCVIAVLIACLGLYGLSLDAVTQRLREVGVRKVFGASLVQIMRLLSHRFVSMIVLSFLLALPLAYYTMREWLTQFTYHIDMPLWVFPVTAVFMVVISMVTVGVHTFRAARTNPAVVLRNE